MSRTPGQLAAALSETPARIEAIRCRSGYVALDDYPGGRRPITIVAVSGMGHTGYGENVAFTEAEQQAFARRAETLVTGPRGCVGELVAGEAGSYERAALEAALIDLALRQAAASLGDLCGRPEAPLRWVASFGVLAQPAADVRAMRAAARATEFKLDVDPSWSDEVVADLQNACGVAILDFKEGGTPALCARLGAALPEAIFEDPPTGCGHGRVSRDRTLLAISDVQAAARQGEAINLKAPRMGGPLSLLRALAEARQQGALTYLGGMFEVGPGREQARQLAALFCGDAPNDLGPVAGALSSALGASPARIRLDRPGFGATCAWETLRLAPLSP